MQADFLQTLETIIASRREADPKESYTARLFESGVRRIAQKVGEEGVELALAAADGERDEVVNEAADLVYHLLVLLNARGITLTDVVAALESRHANM
jgi:phosphoribosyl-AMP cyclohydrolase / phosphoribosyl-ATP pyrophosphohydrolase